jgi:Family of unknown function (DUF6056)
MDRRISIVLVVLLALALARYIALAFYVHPFADDFSYAVAGMRTELLPRLWDEYNLWNGRWLSNILVLRGPLVLGMEQGLWLYRLIPLLLLALSWFGAYALIRSLARGMDPRNAAVGAALFLLLYLQLMPDLSEGIYWYTGAVSYLLPGALMLLLFASWLRTYRAPRHTRARWVALNVLLTVIIAGCNELHMVFMVLFHVALLWLRWRSARKVDRKMVVVLVFACLAAAVMIAAPGNSGRSAQFPHKHELGHTLLWGGLQTGRFLLTWVLSPALLITSFLFLASGSWLRSRLCTLVLVFNIRPMAVFALLVIMVFVAMALPYWSTGLLGQHRTVNAALLFFLPLWFLMLTMFGIDPVFKPGHRVVLSPLHRGLVLALLVPVFFFTGSGARVGGDLVSGRMGEFDAQLGARYAAIERAKLEGRTDLLLPSLTTKPHSLRYLDGSFDGGQWINRSIAYYFGADSLWITIDDRPSIIKEVPEPR